MLFLWLTTIVVSKPNFIQVRDEMKFGYEYEVLISKPEQSDFFDDLNLESTTDDVELIYYALKWKLNKDWSVEVDPSVNLEQDFFVYESDYTQKYPATKQYKGLTMIFIFRIGNYFSDSSTL